MHRFLLLVLALVAGLVSAKQVVVTVGQNNSNDASKLFQPASVVAQTGDTVLFNFTFGNHTVTQSTFSSPCIPAHDTDSTINGFNSGFRNAGNSQAITNLPVVVQDSNTTIWFFDYNSCAQGGVGGININESSTETLQGFQRNAARLNGSASSTSSSATATTPATSTTASSPTHSSGARRTMFIGSTTVLSLFIGVLQL